MAGISFGILLRSDRLTFLFFLLQVTGDLKLRGSHHSKIPRVASELKWTLVTSGSMPRPGQTYDAWIVCEPYFASAVCFHHIVREFL